MQNRARRFWLRLLRVLPSVWPEEIKFVGQAPDHLLITLWRQMIKVFLEAQQKRSRLQ
jgi:hypothetical protein